MTVKGKTVIVLVIDVHAKERIVRNVDHIRQTVKN